MFWFIISVLVFVGAAIGFGAMIEKDSSPGMCLYGATMALSLITTLSGLDKHHTNIAKCGTVQLQYIDGKPHKRTDNGWEICN